MDISLTKKQKEILNCDSRNILIHGGVGAGKTFLLLAICLDMIYKYKGLHAIFTSSSYEQLKVSVLKEWEDLKPKNFIKRESRRQNNLTIYFKNGSSLLFRGFTRESQARSINAGALFVDELVDMKKHIYDSLLNRIRQKGVKIKCVSATNPCRKYGKNSWVYRHFIGSSARHKKEFNIRDFHVTYKDNMNNLNKDFEEILEMKKVQDRFSYENDVLGNWNSFDEYQIFKLCNENFLPSKEDLMRQYNVSEYSHSKVGLSFNNIIGGVDFGGRSEEAVLIVGIKVDLRKGYSYTVLDEYKEIPQDISYLGNVLLDFKNLYGVSRFYCDNQNYMVINELNKLDLGLNCVPCKKQSSDSKVVPSINYLQTQIQLRNLKIMLSCKKLINEMEHYKWDRTSNFDKLKVIKTNDHLIDALRYAILSNYNQENLIKYSIGVNDAISFSGHFN